MALLDRFFSNSILAESFCNWIFVMIASPMNQWRRCYRRPTFTTTFAKHSHLWRRATWKCCQLRCFLSTKNKDALPKYCQSIAGRWPQATRAHVHLSLTRLPVPSRCLHAMMTMCRAPCGGSALEQRLDQHNFCEMMGVPTHPGWGAASHGGVLRQFFDAWTDTRRCLIEARRRRSHGRRRKMSLLQ